MKRIPGLACLVLGLWLASCEGDSSAAQPEDPAPIVLGAVYNRSGAQAGLDIPSSQGAHLAARQINRRGGVMQRPLDLEDVDGESKLDLVASRTADLIRRFPTLTALVGLSDTDNVLAAASAGQRHVFLTSGATSPKLPEQVPDYLFLACFGDNVQAAAGAELCATDLGAHTVAVLFDSTQSYTQLLHGYFETRFQQMGGQVVGVVPYTSVDDLPQAVAQLPAADVVYLSAGPQKAPLAVTLIRQNGFTGPIVGGDALDSESFGPDHPEVDNVYFSTHAYLGADNPDPRVKQFLVDFQAEYHEPPSAFAALGYDATQLLAEAIERAHSTDPEAVRVALAAISHYEGVTGTLAYPSGSRIPSKAVSLIRVHQGVRSLARAIVPSDVPAP